MLGKDGGKLKEMCDYNITFPYKETARIQEHHIMTYHMMWHRRHAHAHPVRHDLAPSDALPGSAAEAVGAARAHLFSSPTWPGSQLYRWPTTV